jgi:protein TonB
MNVTALTYSTADPLRSRRLALALAASVGLHAAAGWLVPEIEHRATLPARTLEVVVVTKPEPPAPASEQAAPQKPPASAQPAPAPAAQQATPRRKAPPERRKTPKPAQAPAPIAMPAEPTAPEAVAPSSEAPDSPPPTPVARRWEAPKEPPVAPSAESLAGYGNTLSRLIARHREYPPLAQARGWEGAVSLRLRIAPGGTLLDATVEQSSGHRVLDAQALEMVNRIARLPRPPNGWIEREFAVIVPVVFRLEKSS